jgi:hypothetical protein
MTATAWPPTDVVQRQAQSPVLQLLLLLLLLLTLLVAAVWCLLQQCVTSAMSCNVFSSSLTAVSHELGPPPLCISLHLHSAALLRPTALPAACSSWICGIPKPNNLVWPAPLPQALQAS